MKNKSYKIPDGYFAFIDLFFPENRYVMSAEEKQKYDAILEEFAGDQRAYDTSPKTIEAILIESLPAADIVSDWVFLSNISVPIPINRVYWEEK